MSERDLPMKGNITSEVRVDPGLNETEPLWTVNDVANFLRLKPDTVRLMARRHEIPSVQIKRRWRFRRQDIEHWVTKMSEV